MSGEHISAEEAATLAPFEVMRRGWIWVRKPTWCPTCLLPSAVPMRRVVWEIGVEGVERKPLGPWGLFCSDHDGWIQ